MQPARQPRPITADETVSSLDDLTEEVRTLNSHRFIRLQNSVLRMVFFQFMRGLAFGLGSVLGATILVSVLGFWLSQIELLPVVGDLLGDWAKGVAQQIRQEMQ